MTDAEAAIALAHRLRIIASMNTARTAWVFATAMVFTSAGRALGQINDGWQMETAEPLTPWMAILYSLLGLVLICIGAFKRAKRERA